MLLSAALHGGRLSSVVEGHAGHLRGWVKTSRFRLSCFFPYSIGLRIIHDYAVDDGAVLTGEVGAHRGLTHGCL
jgi:hypothetical protein